MFIVDLAEHAMERHEPVVRQAKRCLHGVVKADHTLRVRRRNWSRRSRLRAGGYDGLGGDVGEPDGAEDIAYSGCLPVSPRFRSDHCE